MVRSYREERERQETAIDGIEGGDLEFWKETNRLITFKQWLISNKGERDKHEETVSVAGITLGATVALAIP